MDEATRQLQKSAESPTSKLVRLIQRAQENPAFQKKVRDNLETIAGAVPEELKILSLETLYTTLELAPYLRGEGMVIYSKHAKTLLNLLVHLRRYEHDKQNASMHEELDNLTDDPQIKAMIAQLEAGSHIQDKFNEKDKAIAEKDARISQLEDLARQSEKNTKILYNKSIHDPLIGIFNRGYFNETFHHEVKEAQKYVESPLSLIMFDVDNFKDINDSYQHEGGDFVLQTLPSRFPFSRPSDIACRYGGDEFAIILSETHEPAAYKLAEELRVKVEQERFIYRGVRIPVTLSIGVAQFQPGESEQEFKRRVDALLYVSKRLGKNAASAWADWGATIELGAKHG